MRPAIIRVLATLLPVLLAVASAAHSAGPAPGIDPARLEALREAAEASNSSALIVLHAGRTVLATHFDTEPVPIEAMSVTKSVVNLAIGRLFTEGLVSSLDQPVHAYFPEWRQGRKQDITLRHLLAHTSGIQNVRNTNVEIYPSPDFVRLALAAELEHAPGEHFAYNNKTLNLIPAIVKQLTGQRIDDWLREGLFAEMGITHFTWSLDEAGNAHGMSGLQILPADLAKLGQLMLQGGQWEGRQLISPEWIEQSLQAAHPSAPNSGLLWWRIAGRTRFHLDQAQIDALSEAGVEPAFIARLAPLMGVHESQADFTARLAEVLGDDWSDTLRESMAPAQSRGLSLSRREFLDWKGYAGRGYLGQYLVVYPDRDLVAVRMITADRHRYEDGRNFPAFEAMVDALLP